MIRLNIDGKEVSGHKGQTILEIARQNGVDIPTLCYDGRLEPYGSCGMCVVEVEGNRKLLRSCATEAADGMTVHTNTKRVTDARKFTLELLLSEHRGDCRPPCVIACPTHCDAQGYAALISSGQYEEAVKLIKETVPLPASVGRICPHPCEEKCRRDLVDEPVSICNLKRFAGDYDLASARPYVPEVKQPNGMRVAIIGAGPAGLSAGYFLKRDGYAVTIFEKMPDTGGMLRYGIPEYRLPKSVLAREISSIEDVGLDIRTGMVLGRDFTIDSLRSQGFDAVLLAVGAQKSSGMRAPGDDAEGVMGGIELLRMVAMNQPVALGRKVIVVGGGNTAMDAARTAVRMGAEEVTVAYRRTKNEMPARAEEIEEAEQEGVKFLYLAGPKEVISSGGRMTGVNFQKMQLGQPDASGRRSPVPIPGEEIYIAADTCVAAIGQQIDADGLEGVAINRNRIVTEAGTYRTSIPYVFAAGDAVTGPDIAVRAIATGKEAARAIEGCLSGRLVPTAQPYLVKQEDITPEDLAGREKIARKQPEIKNADVRRDNFGEYLATFDEQSAREEGARCLECGCLDYFECKLYQYSNMYDVDPQSLPGLKPKRDKDYSSADILRDPNKCILCGLCVRVCDEMSGVSTLGYVKRGFEATTKPEFEKLLSDSTCIMCGQCAYVCPTGAIMSVNRNAKPVPVRVKKTDTTCTGCGLACPVTVETRGQMIMRIEPRAEGPLDEALLCEKGSFGFDWINGRYAVEQPMMRADGNLKEISMEDAVRTAAKEIVRFNSANAGKLALLASPSLTNEEGLALRQAFEGYVLDDKFFVPGGDIEADAVTLKNMEMADVIITEGLEMRDYPQVYYWIRKAEKRGAKHYKEDYDEESLKQAKRPCLVYHENSAGRTGGILELRSDVLRIPVRDGVNVRGLEAMGYDAVTQDELGRMIGEGQIAGLITVGNIDGLNPLALAKLDMLIDITPAEKDLRPLAKIVIPFASPLEEQGSMDTDFGRRTLKRAIDGIDGMEVISLMAKAFGREIRLPQTEIKECIYLR